MVQDLIRAGSSLRVCGEKEWPNTGEIDLIVTHDCGERNRWPERQLIVFVRDPIECAASWYKLDVLGKDGKEDSYELFREFALNTVVPYWIAFVQEYVLYQSQVDQHCNVFGYKNFVLLPALGLATIANILGAEIDVKRALEAVPAQPKTNHKTYKHYVQTSIVKDMKRALGPYPALLQQRGLI